MSRKICVDLYDEIIKIRPDWHSDDIDKCKIKVVMTGSVADNERLQAHIGGKQRRDTLGIKRPDVSILSEEFLEEVKGMKEKNLAAEMLKKYDYPPDKAKKALETVIRQAELMCGNVDVEDLTVDMAAEENGEYRV